MDWLIILGDNIAMAFVLTVGVGYMVFLKAKELINERLHTMHRN